MSGPLGLPDPATFDWIFFDCFNTLIEDTDDSGEAYGFCGVWQAAVQQGVVASEAEAAERYRSWRMARRQATDVWREASLEERLQVVIGGHAARPEVLNFLRQTWYRNFSLQTGAIGGVPAMLAHWKALKPLAVVSNFYVAGYPREMMERRCLLPYVQWVMDSAEVGAKKPDARIYHAALRQAGITDPARVLFIGDNWTNDVMGPRAIGMQTVWFDRGGPRPDGVEHVPSIREWDQFR